MREFSVDLHPDGTFDVYDMDEGELLLRPGAEFDAWLADMEQRIAQARSRS